MNKPQSDPGIIENREWRLALEFICATDAHLFLTGKAGTGKTTFLKNLKTISPKRMIIAAPTGVAAINAGGVTLHSFFQLPLGPYFPGSKAFLKNKDRLFRFSKEKKHIIKAMDLLVIDEISMVRADVLDAVDEVLRYHRRNNRPFGGVQLLLIGDLYQLPPVVLNDEWALLQQHYPGMYFFNSQAVNLVDLVTIELKEVFRQADDRFIRILNQVRENSLDTFSAQELNKRLCQNFTSFPDKYPDHIILTTHNKNADEINRTRLEAINADAFDLDADISGDFPEHGYPTFARLTLKPGARVMFLRNDASGRGQYYNGKTGIVSDVSKDKIKVLCPGDTAPISLEPVAWENIKYIVDQDHEQITEQVIGRFKQFPLKPAWAVTIHKSQGLTFEKAVIDAQAAFAQGQVYVALSRCTSLDGLILSSPFPEKGPGMDKAVLDFFKSAAPTSGTLGEPLKGRLWREKIAYQQKLLIFCFNFQKVFSHLTYLARLLNSNKDLVRVSGVTDINAVVAQVRVQIFAVSEKFKLQLQQNFPENSLPVPDAYIQERVQKACAWFQAKFADILDPLLDRFAIETDNKALKKKITATFNRLHRDTALKRAGITSCENKFSPESYLRAVSKADIEFSTPKRKKKTPPPDQTESDIEHPQLFEALRKWRYSTAKKKGFAAYQILHQRALIQIAVEMPVTEKELKNIYGVGKKTIANYGEDILAMVKPFKEKAETKTGQIKDGQ